MQNRPTFQHGGLLASRIVGLMVGIATAGWLIVTALDRANVDVPAITLSMARNQPGRIETGRKAGKAPVLVLGDSTVVSYPPGRQVPQRLRQALVRTSPDAPPLVNLALLGLSYFEYYPFADRIASLEPGAIVVAFNLQWLSDAWRNMMSRPEVFGWLPPRDLPDAFALPLYRWSITADRLLLYTGLVQAGLVEPWYRYRLQQVRTGSAVNLVRAKLQDRMKNWAGGTGGQATGLPPQPPAGTKERPNRFNPRFVDRLYGAAFSGIDRDYPPLQIFAALIDRFGRNGIPVIVYIVPANMEYMRSLGLVDEKGLAETIDTLSTLVYESGGILVDLHELLPDQAFRDATGHFTHEGEYDGPQLVASRLLPVVQHLLFEASGSE